jgi:hypothetical protein
MEALKHPVRDLKPIDKSIPLERLLYPDGNRPKRNNVLNEGKGSLPVIKNGSKEKVSMPTARSLNSIEEVRHSQATLNS